MSLSVMNYAEVTFAGVTTLRYTSRYARYRKRLVLTVKRESEICGNVSALPSEVNLSFFQSLMLSAQTSRYSTNRGGGSSLHSEYMHVTASLYPL